VTGKLPLAFAAAEQGIIAVEAIAGHETQDLAYENIPRCVYSDIELASVGLTAKQAAQRGHEITIVKEPVAATGMAPGKGGGFVKLIADGETQKVLGATMLGGDATGKISIPARMIGLGATVPELLKALSLGRQP
jgi:dihydrolipoamide dehydrogenase